MAFGLSFGAKKNKINQTSTVDKTETGTQTGAETTSGIRTGTSTSTGTTAGTSTGSSSTTGSSSQSSSTTGSQSQTGTTRSFGQQVLRGLEGGVTSLLSQILDPEAGDRAMIMRGLDSMGGFDVDAFVQGNLAAARAQEGTRLDELIGSIFSRVGGTRGNNSAATLLEERARNDSAANLAGVESQARAAGADIVRRNVETGANAVTAAGQNLLPALASILKGGETTTDIATLTEELGQVLGQTTGDTQTAEQTGQTTQQTAATVENLVQAVLSALTQQTHTTGTETTKGKTSEMGGGFSLSL